MTSLDVPNVVLASSSAARATMLQQAGIEFVTDPATIDEEEIRRAFRADGGNARDAAHLLAEMKAVQVSHRHPEGLVIGADQILDCAGVWFDKPRDTDRLRADLLALRGCVHHQISAACVARNGAPIWRHDCKARLVMRRFSDRFLDQYLAIVGAKVLDAAGGYHLESFGVQLFSEIDGDYFTVLGMPLLAVLAFLREHHVVGT
jgi:septum formation protein